MILEGPNYVRRKGLSNVWVQSDALHVEYKAILEGLKYDRREGLSNVWVQSDSEEVNFLYGFSVVPWHVQSIVKDILKFVNLGRMVKFTHIHRTILPINWPMLDASNVKNL